MLHIHPGRGPSDNLKVDTLAADTGDWAKGLTTAMTEVRKTDANYAICCFAEPAHRLFFYNEVSIW
jgi:hypothetical protein